MSCWVLGGEVPTDTRDVAESGFEPDMSSRASAHQGTAAHRQGLGSPTWQADLEGVGEFM